MSIANEFNGSTRIEDNAMPPGIPIDNNDWKQDVSHFTYADLNIETVVDRIWDVIGPYDNESLFENRDHEIIKEIPVEEPYYGDIMKELENQADIEDRLRIQHEWEVYAAERYHQEMNAYYAAQRMDIYTRYCRQQWEAEQAMHAHHAYMAQQAHLAALPTVIEKKPKRHYYNRKNRNRRNKKKTKVVV
jgi:muconolactone delta-isomerase